MKSESHVYSIDDLCRDKTTPWDGVRNYQARNFMRDQMKLGDLVIYYHSNSDPTGIAGLAKVSREAYPDPTQFDTASKYFDAKATQENPRWQLVNLEFVEKFQRTITLTELEEQEPLADMLVVQKGQRLSVQPVSKEHFKYVLRLAQSTIRIR